MVFGSVMIAAKVVYCVNTLPKVLTDNLRYVVELVLPENFVPRIKTLRECLAVQLILS